MSENRSLLFEESQGNPVDALSFSHFDLSIPGKLRHHTERLTGRQTKEKLSKFAFQRGLLLGYERRNVELKVLTDDE